MRITLLVRHWIILNAVVVMMVGAGCRESRKSPAPAKTGASTPPEEAAKAAAGDMAAPGERQEYVTPLTTWDLPEPPAFSPDGTIHFIHNAHDSWNRKTCAGAGLDNLKNYLAHSIDGQPFWVGPDSLAPRHLDPDLRSEPPDPKEWVAYLRSAKVRWMAIGRDDLQLGQTAVEQFHRDTGMRFLSDIWSGSAFDACVVETIARRRIGVCVITSKNPDANAYWTRVRTQIEGADLSIVFLSGDPAWQKTVVNLPHPPDLFIMGGIQSFAHGRILENGAIAVASGAELHQAGELRFKVSSGPAPGISAGPRLSADPAASRYLLVSEHGNLLTERRRLEFGFDNLSRALSRPNLKHASYQAYSHRLHLIRGEWERLATRAAAWNTALSSHAGNALHFQSHTLPACGQ